MTPEERIYRNYLDAVDRHDLEGVMDCFHEDPVFVAANGVRFGHRAEVQRAFRQILDAFVEGRCELRQWKYDSGVGVAEWSFYGASQQSGAVKSVGADIIWFQDGKLKELHVYFQPVLLDSETLPKPEHPPKLAPPGSRIYR